MKVTMQLTMDGMLRALRGRGHLIGDRLAPAGLPRAPVVTRESDSVFSDSGPALGRRNEDERGG